MDSRPYTRCRALLCAAALTLLAAAPGAWAWGRDEPVRGSGRVASESRALTGYNGLSVKGSFEVILRPSGREGIELSGDDNLLPLIETRVVDAADAKGGRVLELRWRDGVSVSSRNDIVATIDVAALRSVAVAGSASVSGSLPATTALALSVAGSGDLALTQLKTDELSVSVAGSGDVTAGGRTTRLAVAIAGSGDVDTDALEADEVSVRVAGSGDAAVTARKRLAVSIAGSGDVVYRGEAQTQVSVAGSGSVRKH